MYIASATYSTRIMPEVQKQASPLCGLCCHNVRPWRKGLGFQALVDCTLLLVGRAVSSGASQTAVDPMAQDMYIRTPASPESLVSASSFTTPHLLTDQTCATDGHNTGMYQLIAPAVFFGFPEANYTYR